MAVNKLTNPLASIEEDLPPAVSIQLPQVHETPLQTKARLMNNREVFLRESGYTIVPDGAEKVLKVNREWIAQGGDVGQWLLFIAKAEPLKAREVIFLDEINTEQESVDVTTERESFSCGRKVMLAEKKTIRSAYMISHGRVAYRS